MSSLKLRIQKLRTKFKLTIAAAIWMSLYAYYVEYLGDLYPNNRALCDISENISCSKAFNSAYGKGFGFLHYIFGKDSIFNQPNSLYGAMFYMAQLVLDKINPNVWASYNRINIFEDMEFKATKLITMLQIGLSVVANCGSVCLAFILFFKLNNLCIVCTMMYVFNAYILYCLVISIYAKYVGLRKEEDNFYKALCDINEAISCTKALNSEYGKGFGILSYIIPQNSSLNQPNSIFGVLCYTILFILELQNSVNACKLQTAISFTANLGTIYLSYILIFKIKTFCTICVATYIINAAMLYLNYVKLKLLKISTRVNKKKI